MLFSRCGILTVTLCVASLVLADDPPVIQKVVNDLDQPFLFVYGSWENKVEVASGAAAIRDATNQGGAGLNQMLDLSADPAASLAVRVKTGSSNQMKAIRVMLLTELEQKPSWLFDLPPSDGQWHWITPHDGASLLQPNTLEEGNGKPLQLSKIKQWQFGGDWIGGVPADLEIDQIAIVKPSAEMMAQRDLAQQQSIAAAEDAEAQQNALRQKFSERTETSPRLSRVSMVAPNWMAIEIQAGVLTPSTYSNYERQPNDQVTQKKDDAGNVTEVLLARDGNTVGWLVGKERNQLVTYGRVVGQPLLDFVADDPKNYSIKVDDMEVIVPVAVHRKTRVNGWAQGSRELALHHTIYLNLARPIADGAKVSVNLSQLNTRELEAKLEFDSMKTRSESVHVNQIGYRPDDPIKRAFVSCWLGNGGVLQQPNEIPFSIVDDRSDAVVYRAKGVRHFPADRLENMARKANFNGTDVAKLEFTDFKTPGRYRVVVDGVGCSYPFEIGEHVWTTAWRTQLRGLYHNRSGIELGPPYTTFHKPRDMNPVDGYRVTRSTYRAVEKGNEAFAELVAGDIGELVPGGWGGYHDAGDWNPRRVTHMRVTMAMLELYDQFPQDLKSFDLNIPKTKGLPDLLTEAVFEFSCFRRLQHENGGVGLGLESKGDPLPGETSWTNSFASYAYAPDYSASWCYAGVAARLSRLLEPFDASLAADYLESGKRAFAFAEEDFSRDQKSGLTAKRDETWRAIDHRNLACLELYRTTHDQRYHELFLQDTSLTDDEPNLFQYGVAVQQDHAFQYARLPKGWGDETLKTKAIAAIERNAEQAILYASQNAFNVTSVDPFKPQFIGFYSTADAFDLTRAHALTGKEKYLIGAVQATQFQSGCNPNNVVYTTGLGANPLKNVFKLDASFTGQEVPAGLTPYGNIDLQVWNNEGTTWPIKWVIGNDTLPNPYEWPVHEAYWDLGGWPMLEEFTVDAWAPNVLVWGYLALHGPSR